MAYDEDTEDLPSGMVFVLMPHNAYSEKYIYSL